MPRFLKKIRSAGCRAHGKWGKPAVAGFARYALANRVVAFS